MKKLFAFTLCTLLALMMTNCSDEKENPAENEEPFLQVKPSDGIIFEAAGGTEIIEVTTNQNTWTVESNQTWCEVKTLDDTHFTVTAQENTLTKPQPLATVVVKAGTELVAFNVNQNAGKLSIKIEVTDISAYYAMLKLTPSDDEALYTAVCVLTDDFSGIENEDELMDMVIKYYQPPILSGEHPEPLMPLNASTDYSVFAFGLNEDKTKPTTQLFRYDFTTPEATVGRIKVDSIAYKFFDAEEIVTQAPQFSETVEGCEVVAVVEMKTSEPTDKVLMWWYEAWLNELGDEKDAAIMEDLMLPNVYNKNPEFMPMYYSMSDEDSFFFAGAVADENDNFSEIYYTDMFYLDHELCSPVEEFFEILNSPGSKASVFAIGKSQKATSMTMRFKPRDLSRSSRNKKK